MTKIQKETYLNLILSSPYSDDYFASKSITLDFLYGFDNPCTAIVYLNEYLSEDNHLGIIGLNSVLGVLLAVEEYKKFYPTVIVHKFLETLIHIVTHKLDDYSIKNYNLCMEKIIEFIGNNINFKLLKEFVDLGIIFTYSDDNEKVKKLFDVYCSVLKDACKKLSKENYILLMYKIVSLKNTYQAKIDHTTNNESLVLLKKVYAILDSIDVNRVSIISNRKNEGEALLNKLRNQYKFLNVHLLEKEDISSISSGCEEKVIFLIDFEAEDAKEMLYLCGKIEKTVQENNFLACFYNRNMVQTIPILINLVDRYSDENNFEDRLHNFMKTCNAV